MLTESRKRFEIITSESPAEFRHNLVQVTKHQAGKNCKVDINILFNSFVIQLHNLVFTLWNYWSRCVILGLSMQLIMCFYVFRHGYLGSGPHTRIKCLLRQGHISISLWCLQSYHFEGIAHMVHLRRWGSHLIQGAWHLVRYIAQLYLVSFVKLY